MNKYLKIILVGLVIGIAGYCFYFIYVIVKYSHTLDWDTYKQYIWLFDEQIIDEEDINYDFSYSYVKDSDIYNNIHYRNYNIIIWEFKNFEIDDIDEIAFNKNIPLGNIKFKKGEVLNKNSDLEITIEYNFTFDKNISVNLDDNTQIDTMISNDNYVGFCGVIDKFSLSSGIDEHGILFDYTLGKTLTLFLIYEKEKKHYIILVNSNDYFDESLIDMFDLGSKN